MFYQMLRANNWHNIWVVGDLHGCRAQLLRHDFDRQQDLLLSVGGFNRPWAGQPGLPAAAGRAVVPLRAR